MDLWKPQNGYDIHFILKIVVLVRKAQEKRLKLGTRFRHATRSLKYFLLSFLCSFSWRFFVELMGLSKGEKLTILNKIEEVEYDRQRAMAAITHVRKVRYFHFYYILPLGIKRWRQRYSSPVIRNSNLRRANEAR